MCVCVCVCVFVCKNMVITNKTSSASLAHLALFNLPCFKQLLEYFLFRF